LRGAILEYSGRGISGWIVDSQSPAATVSISLFIASHCVEEGRTGRSMPASIGPRSVIGRPGFRIDLSTPGVRRRLARALRNALVEPKHAQIYLRISLNDGEYYEIPLFESLRRPRWSLRSASRPRITTTCCFRTTTTESLRDRRTPPSKEVRYICFLFAAIPLIRGEMTGGGDRGSPNGPTSRGCAPSFRRMNRRGLPADLGFYDVRLPETRRQQGDLARKYGIDGFCYYVYWFQGRRLLEKRSQLMLEDGEPNLPFCICWANENWSRRWDGSDAELLLGQNHSLDDDVRFIDRHGRPAARRALHHGRRPKDHRHL
jgi:hypothetical protein